MGVVACYYRYMRNATNDRPAIIDGKLVRYSQPVIVNDGITQEMWDASHCDECGENHQDCYCEQSELLDDALFGEY